MEDQIPPEFVEQCLRTVETNPKETTEFVGLCFKTLETKPKETDNYVKAVQTSKIVNQEEIGNKKSDSNHVTVDMIPDDICPETHQLVVQKAIEFTLGTENDYLQRLLLDKLEGKIRQYRHLPLRQIFWQINRDRIKKNLESESLKSQISLLENQNQQLSQIFTSSQNQSNVNDNDKNRVMTNWVTNTLLLEKLKEREEREKSDYWKYVNGGLLIVSAIILPLVAVLLDHFLMKYYDA